MSALKVVAAVAAAALLGCGGAVAGTDGGAGGGSGGGTGGGSAGGTGGGGADAGFQDSDIALVRLNSDGSRDLTFGDAGVSIIDFGPGASSARDALWSIDKDSAGRVLLFGSRKSSSRDDADRVVARVGTTGGLDTTFGTQGFSVLDLGGADSSRNGLVQPDGKIIASGYSVLPTGALPADGGVSSQTTNFVVLVRLNSDGSRDQSFGDAGVVAAMPYKPADPVNTLWGLAESYGVALQSTGHYVTGGYGRSAATGTVDLCSFRFDSSGTLDKTWGTNGVLELDLIGDNDRSRQVVALPDNRVLYVGSAVPMAGQIRGLVAMATPTGQFDTGFNPGGYKLYDFQRPEQAFFGLALAPNGNAVAAVGYRSGMVGGVAEDDDATLLVLPVNSNGGVESAQVSAVSESSHDRFWSVAYDNSGRIYAAGFINEGGDTKMVVVRFSAAGVKDTTFGTQGAATINVVAAGTEESARAITVLADGKIVIAGPVEKK